MIKYLKVILFGVRFFLFNIQGKQVIPVKVCFLFPVNH